MTARTVERTEGAERERLHWSFDIGARSHTIDLLPAAVGGSVSLRLDGRAIGRMSKPKPQRPWQETTLEIDGRPVVVALIWHRPVMRTNVFVDRRSLRDGRTIDDARNDAPTPLSDYETWIGGVFRGEVPPRRPLLPRPLAVLALAAIVVPVASLALLPRPMSQTAAVAWGAVAVVAYLILLLIWLRSWGVVMARTHMGLLARPELGDARRLALFFAAFVGYGVASVAALWAVFGILAFASG